jgi:hypothetical protein
MLFTIGIATFRLILETYANHDRTETGLLTS